MACSRPRAAAGGCPSRSSSARRAPSTASRPGSPAPARDLIEAFWPGGLTVVASVQPSLQWDLGETGGTVAVRMPLHPVALELLRATGPMAVSSANRSGLPPATTCDEAVEQLGEAVSIYLDGGPAGDPVRVHDRRRHGRGAARAAAGCRERRGPPGGCGRPGDRAVQ